MFGQMIFAELPFAEVGKPPYVETGWIKDGKEDCRNSGWVKQGRNAVGTLNVEANTNNWTLKL